MHWTSSEKAVVILSLLFFFFVATLIAVEMCIFCVSRYDSPSTCLVCLQPSCGLLQNGRDIWPSSHKMKFLSFLSAFTLSVCYCMVALACSMALSAAGYICRYLRRLARKMGPLSRNERGRRKWKQPHSAGEGTKRDIGLVLYDVIRGAAAMTLAPSTMQASSNERRVKGLSP